MIKFFTSIGRQSKTIQWLNLVSVSLVLITIIRGLEWNLTLSYHSISDSLNLWEWSGLLHDFFSISILLIGLGVLQMLLSYLNVILAKFLTIIGLIVAFIFQILLVFYFEESLTPLSVSDIFGMSQNQVGFIWEIYGFNLWYLIGIIPLLLALYGVFILLMKLMNYKWIRLVSLVLMVFSLSKGLLFPTNENTFEQELKYHIVSNKVYFFVKSWFTYQDDERLNSDQFIPKTEFPFFSNEEVKDVLSPFFEGSKTPPNIVFIISESLGKQYSGKEARLGSFTPFLDSLAEHSLYWQNVVANAERTFGAIPNLLTGLPEGDKGFTNLLWRMPDHLSLPLLLKEQNNYQTGFYCGAWKNFDNMANYLMFQKFDFILGQSNFEPNLIDHTIVEGEKQFDMKNWGAEDYEVFRQSMDNMSKNYDSLKPFFNLYLSTSFHKPYAYTNQSLFNDKALNRIESFVNKEKREEYIKQLTDFGAILYADYSMQQLFEMYKEAGLFENTIFVIVGDHSLKFMSDNTRLEKFHVPLLIYSPLLKRSKDMKSMACQKDVPSAMQALLKNTFNLKLPEFSISQTNGLDTLKKLSFDNQNFVMMNTNKRMVNYIDKNILLSDNMLFQIGENLKISKIEDQPKLIELQEKLERYKGRNSYVCTQNKLMSSEVLNRFTDINYQLNLFKDFTVRRSDNSGKDSISNQFYYSKPNALKVVNMKFVSLLENQLIKCSTRVRVVVKFKLLLTDGELPQLVLSQPNLSNKDRVLYLNGSDENVFSIDGSDWLSIEASYWIEKGMEDRVNVFLFNPEKEIFYLDDLSIQIRDF